MKKEFKTNDRYKEFIEDSNNQKLKPLVEIRNIFKCYKNNKNVNVLDGVSFAVYENEIFGILGHNGAGKSTLIKIMTGLLKSDYGDVIYEGKNLNTHLNTIQKNIGICLQDNILYSDLTVEENIILFSGLKNVKVQSDEILNSINLIEKKYSKTNDLSGGQKRKLCIGLALIGNPKYVFLDEPTTSLDPLSKRKIWNLLLKIKKDRVIFISTHFMDEADIITDRKMILNRGKIRCLGTSIYLKKRFNMKYTLNIETKNREIVENVVKKIIPEAQYIEQNGNNIKGGYNGKDDVLSYHSWKLPMALTEKYSTLFNELDKLKKVHLENFSLISPYLEELFVNLTKESFEDAELLKENITDENGKQNIENKLSIGENIDIKELSKVNGMSSNKNITTMNKIAGLIKLRLLILFRNKTFIMVYFVLPIILLGLFFYKIKDYLYGDKYQVFNETEISMSEMYKGCQMNYDSKNSNMKFYFNSDTINYFMNSNQK